MRHFVILITLISVVVLGSVKASATCSTTVRNCFADSLIWCSYDGDSFWDTLYVYGSYTIESGDTGTVECDSDDSCYITVATYNVAFLCTTISTEGFVDCNEYACVGLDGTDTDTWYSGDSEYSCSDNACTTDSD